MKPHSHHLGPLLLLILCLAYFAQAQDLSEDYSFYRNPNISVSNSEHTLAQAWAGGINGVRFSEIDLDQDGIPDLFAFEKHGNRILPFLHRNDHYVYAPEYARRFPDLHDWVILKDYDGDGKPDIFTYGLAGIRVFRNTSDTTLSFRPVTEQLTAFYYNGYVNIYASPDDYLVIDDIDGDGHLDILNFWVLGKYVHHLRNNSNDPEVFDFRLESECWGHFEEAADNNAITLNSDCGSKSDDGHTRHTGSSMLLHDFDHNGLPDILIGDVDYPNLILLYNNGTQQEARMTEQDTTFPVGNPVHLYSMPAPSMVHLPDQEYPTLLVSPSDPSLTKSQDLNSVWRYDYDTLLQQYTLTNTAFLQEEMLDVGSGCHPVLYDWNGDGLQDLFLANYGSYDSSHLVNGFLTSFYSSSIQYYRNVGTAHQPAFQLQDNDFGKLKSSHLKALHPAFGDFDGDGQPDMLCGQEDGTLLLIPHQRLVTGTGEIILNYQNIDAGSFSTPAFFDLDRDGRNDLIIGNQRGILSYYRNIGTVTAPVFERVTDTLGGVDVRNAEQSYYGYSVPCLYRDSLNGTTLFCGSEQGLVFYYKSIDGHLSDAFSAQGILWESADSDCQYCAFALKEGRRVGAAIARVDDDAHPDIFVGNYAGGAAYFQGRTPVMHHASIPSEHAPAFRVYPNPTGDLLHIRSEQVPIENVNVYDLFGKLLLRSHDSTLRLGSLPNGIYILEINHLTKIKVVKTQK
ncbi:MAG: T9SS type A sorting domain-containing protein [Bacteroidales bacterium]|nr:T9SS type A sorting domain-containing protein [Bacteroidales bacterium]